MANCDFCKQKVSFMSAETFLAGITVNGIDVGDSYTLCNSCMEKVRKAQQKDPAAIQELHDLTVKNITDKAKREKLFPYLNITITDEQRKEEAKQKAAESVRQMSSHAVVDANYIAAAREKLRETGAEGYYEYNVISLVDEGGRTNIQKMAETLNKMGLAGWHLVTSHTNELGKNALMMAGLGINSTADETVLIFERYVKL